MGAIINKPKQLNNEISRFKLTGELTTTLLERPKLIITPLKEPPNARLAIRPKQRNKVK